jgi:hypothetical protein
VNEDDLVALADCCAAESLVEEASRLAFADFEAVTASLLFADVLRLEFAEFESFAESLLSAEAVRLAVRVFALFEDPEAVDDPSVVPFVSEAPLEAVRLLLVLPEDEDVLPLEPVPVLLYELVPLLPADPFGPADAVLVVDSEVPVMSEEFVLVAESSRDPVSESDVLPVLE